MARASAGNRHQLAVYRGGSHDRDHFRWQAQRRRLSASSPCASPLSSIASAKGNSSTISPSSSVTSTVAFKQPLVGAFAAQQFQDHGARHLPGAIGITQLFAFGVGNQLVADPGVEIISGHELELTFGWNSDGDGSHKLFIGLRARPVRFEITIRLALQATAKRLISRHFEPAVVSCPLNLFRIAT